MDSTEISIEETRRLFELLYARKTTALPKNNQPFVRDVRLLREENIIPTQSHFTVNNNILGVCASCMRFDEFTLQLTIKALRDKCNELDREISELKLTLALQHKIILGIPTTENDIEKSLDDESFPDVEENDDEVGEIEDDREV